jgi:hypothetical protein
MASKKPEKHPSGAKAHDPLDSFFGTTKVVPCYKTGVFPQPVKPTLILLHLRHGTQKLAGRALSKLRLVQRFP